MQKHTVRVTLVALLVSGTGVAAMATPSFHSPLRKAVKALQDDAENKKLPYEWALPSVIQSGLIAPGISYFFGDTYAGFMGRSFEVKQQQVRLGITDQVEVFYGRQYALAKGRSSTSRFYDDDDYYGGRVVFKRPTDSDPSAWSFQFEALRPGVGVFTESNTTATFGATEDNTFSVNYGDRRRNQFQASFTSIAAPALYDAHSLSFGAGRDFKLGPSLISRVQASIITQSFTGAGEYSNFEMKSIVSGSLAYEPTYWLSLEADAYALPFGMPFASGEFTGISSFAIYNPGGVIDDLRSDFVAFGSLRLMAHWEF